MTLIYVNAPFQVRVNATGGATMASFIQAFVKYGAKLKREPTVRLDELADRIAALTGQRPSQVTAVLLELHDALVHYCRRGQTLELPGIGFFRPSLRNNGQIRIAYRADKKLKRAIGAIERYRGEVENLQNLGLGPLELKAIWDETHPDDPLEMPFGFGSASPSSLDPNPASS